MMVPVRSFVPGACALLAASALPAAAQKTWSASPPPGRAFATTAVPSGSWLGGSDDCSTPTPIAGTGTFAFDTSFATTDVVGQAETLCAQYGPSGIDSDVWFEWTAPADGTAVIDTCGGAGFDTKIAVYPGGGCPLDGTALACNDDVCGVQSATAWSAAAGSTYLIQVGSFPGAGVGAGTFDLELNTIGGTLGFYAAGMAGNPATAPDPTSSGWSLTAAGNVTATDVSPDGASGLNAWQVDDSDATPPGSLFYEQLYGPEAVAVARHTGWELRSLMRVLTGPTDSVFMEYSTGFGTVHERYHLWFRVSGNDVLVRVLGPNGATFTCTNAMDGGYHAFVMRKPAGQLNLEAEFEYDGAVLGVVTPASATAANANGGVRWGAGNDANTGSANWNELRFDAGQAITGARYCFGDGSGQPCPCGNESAGTGGCGNSTGSGAVLDGAGSNSAGADDLVFNALNLLPNQPALLFVGENAPNMGDGLFFGDGLRCAGQNVTRLGVRVPDANGEASWGPGLGAQGGWGPGDQRFFQGWYRDPSGSPCGSGFNLTNGFRVTFQP